MGDYAIFESAKKGKELTVTYQLVTFVQKIKRACTDYTVSWKGNVVTRVEPMGSIWPLFEKITHPIPPFPRADPARKPGAEKDK